MPQTFATPPIPRLPHAPPVELLPGRATWTSELGHVRVVLDTKSFDFHIDVDPEALPLVVAKTVEQIQHLGFELLDEDECEPELLRNGGTRIYLTPIVPLDDAPLIPVQDRQAGCVSTGFAAFVTSAASCLLSVGTLALSVAT